MEGSNSNVEVVEKELSGNHNKIIYYSPETPITETTGMNVSYIEP